MHKRTGDPVILTESDHAIRRALDNPSLSNRKRAEALAFLGRNLKTRWRLAFRDNPDLAERRRIATTRLLIESYNAYHDAFMIDLNHFWSGLAVLQMNAIARDLSKDAAWQNAFRDPDIVREKFEKEHRELSPIVAQGIRNALVRKGEGDEWADVSEADLGFILGEPTPLLQNFYRDAIARDGFKLDAAIGQLKLFQSLGVSADIAGGIINDLTERFPKESKTERDQESKTERGQYVVVIAGHQIDEPDRAEPRFPAAAEAEARRRLSQALREVVAADTDLAIFASAASGTDLLAHEVR